ncbi:competence protein CoiA [Bacillus chungangensis]|uniref:Competence CoiA-like predicted nuclease n=1 Tax=Bacillus chungangensis TaxID=587633 RepID=A0ABT9WMX5_9BACI|nr:competence protein CoiA family protein [Bacillus chungangensis]MDQ0174640.1 competence CoiA-like predicted nuclease [Bacillus chungangensis]
MFIALDKDGKKVAVHYLGPNEMINFRNRSPFYCPQCQSKLIFKAGKKKIPHFAHQRLINCHAESEPESEMHLQGKKDLYVWLQTMTKTVYLEHYFTSIKQRADIFVKKDGHSYAIEYQCSSIPLRQIIKRTEGYRQKGIIPVWVLGGLPYQKQMKKTTSLYLLNEFQWSLVGIYRSRSYYLLSYKPRTKRFYCLSYLLPVTARKTFGQLHSIPLSKATFPLTVSKETKKSRYSLTDWINEKRQWLNQKVYFTKNRSDPFLKAIYESKLTTYLLPPIIGVPINQNNCKTNVIEWQFYVWHDFLSKLKKGDTFTDHDLFQKMAIRVEKRHIQFRTLLLNHETNQSCDQLFLAYLNVLVKTGYILKYGCSNYQLVKKLSFSQNVEAAYQEERNFYKQYARYLFIYPTSN